MRRRAGFGVAVSALDLAWGYASRQWFVDKGGGFRLLDFACLWSGGDLALRKSAIDAYDYLSMSAAQRDLLGIIVPDDRYFRWVYPPILFFYVMPFALLPYAPAFFAWAAATASLYASAIHRILGPRLAILVALAPGVVAENILLGQTGFLTAGFMGFALVLMERAPFRAGVVLGLLAYRPQLGLLFPIVLVAAGRWGLLPAPHPPCSLSPPPPLSPSGRESWSAFAHSLSAHDPWTLSPDAGSRATLQTLFGIASRAGFDLRIAWAAQIVVAAFTAAFVCHIWRRQAPYELKAAALLAGTLLATPYLLAYDMISIVVPAAFLIRLGLAKGFLPGERTILLLCFLVSLAFVLPVAPLFSRRYWR